MSKNLKSKHLLVCFVLDAALEGLAQIEDLLLGLGDPPQWPEEPRGASRPAQQHLHLHHRHLPREGRHDQDSALPGPVPRPLGCPVKGLGVLGGAQRGEGLQGKPALPGELEDLGEVLVTSATLLPSLVVRPQHERRQALPLAELPQPVARPEPAPPHLRGGDAGHPTWVPARGNPVCDVHRVGELPGAVLPSGSHHDRAPLIVLAPCLRAQRDQRELFLAKAPEKGLEVDPSAQRDVAPARRGLLPEPIDHRPKVKPWTLRGGHQRAPQVLLGKVGLTPLARHPKKRPRGVRRQAR
mmetsp:Transcript_2734/g.10099  ORF Transcript_2734/g.10099 Transcript_2734/m.10099 type:complete len:297 (+) Transcript_2734:1325-2215(+)